MIYHTFYCVSYYVNLFLVLFQFSSIHYPSLGLFFKSRTTQNKEISPSFLMWKFVKRHRNARNCAETVPFHKISTPGNWMSFRILRSAKLRKARNFIKGSSSYNPICPDVFLSDHAPGSPPPSLILRKSW